MASEQPFSEVSGKIAVITGAARGLGQGTAETLAELILKKDFSSSIPVLVLSGMK